MNRNDAFGEILEHGQSAAKVIKKQVADTAKATASQIVGGAAQADQAGQNQPPGVDKNFVKDLYGIKDNTQLQSKQAQPQSPSQKATSDANPTANPELARDPKKIEEQQRLVKLRQELHQTTYYEPLVNPKKEKPEERPAEKVEGEKKQEQIELQQKEKKKPAPLAVKRAQTSAEANRGVSG